MKKLILNKFLSLMTISIQCWLFYNMRFILKPQVWTFYIPVSQCALCSVCFQVFYDHKFKQLIRSCLSRQPEDFKTWMINWKVLKIRYILYKRNMKEFYMDCIWKLKDFNKNVQVIYYWRKSALRCFWIFKYKNC